MVQKSRLRVGAVSFLNTKPLIYPLLNEEIQTEIELSIDVPSRLALFLSRGEIEVGLISSIEYFRANPSPYVLLHFTRYINCVSRKRQKYSIVQSRPDSRDSAYWA